MVVDLWVAYGSPQEVTIRHTSYDQPRQLERLMKEVIPAF